MAAVVVFNEHWTSLLQLSFFLLASIYLLAFDRALPSLLHLLFILAALINAVGWVWDQFEKPGSV